MRPDSLLYVDRGSRENEMFSGTNRLQGEINNRTRPTSTKALLRSTRHQRCWCRRGKWRISSKFAISQLLFWIDYSNLVHLNHLILLKCMALSSRCHLLVLLIAKVWAEFLSAARLRNYKIDGVLEGFEKYDLFGELFLKGCNGITIVSQTRAMFVD